MKNCGTCYFEACLRGTEDPAAYDYPPPCVEMRPLIVRPEMGCTGWRPKDKLIGYLAIMQIKTDNEKWPWRWARLRLIALNATNARFQAKTILDEMGIEYCAIGAHKAVTQKDAEGIYAMYNSPYMERSGPITFIDLN